MNYEELVEALRCCIQNPPETCVGCTYNIGNNECNVKRMIGDAAAAIEALEAEVEELKAKKMKLAENSLRFVGEVRELDKRRFEPKRGKWIIDGAYTYNLRELNGKAYEPVYRCSCCNRQTESYLRLDEPKMPEDADFPEYCPHCGAKMEVQE